MSRDEFRKFYSSWGPSPQRQRTGKGNSTASSSSQKARSSSRPIPPTLDSYILDGKGFGAYDYDPAEFYAGEDSGADIPPGVDADMVESTSTRPPVRDEFDTGGRTNDQLYDNSQTRIKTYPAATSSIDKPDDVKPKSTKIEKQAAKTGASDAAGSLSSVSKDSETESSDVDEAPFKSVFDLLSEPVGETSFDDDTPTSFGFPYSAPVTRGFGNADLDPRTSRSDGVEAQDVDRFGAASLEFDRGPAKNEQPESKANQTMPETSLAQQYQGPEYQTTIDQEVDFSTAANTVYTDEDSRHRSFSQDQVPPPWQEREEPSSQFQYRTSDGSDLAADLEAAKGELDTLVSQIYQQNNDKEFNVNSPKQVSNVLHGAPGESTTKDTLEAMASAGNRMADLILQHRTVKSDIRRIQRRLDTQDVRVSSASTIARSGNVTITNTTSNENVTISKLTEEEADPLLLVDASAYIFRAYYSMPPIHRSDGMPTGAVLGFCNMLNRLILKRLIDGEQPRLVLVFDAKGKNFRHDIYSEYKAHRPEAPIDLIPQFGLIRQAAKAYGIPQVEAPNYEADDVIATMATLAALGNGQEDDSGTLDVNILSGDKDLMQLVTDKDAVPSIHMIDPMTMARVTYDQVVEKWGVGPHCLGDLLALAGDSADNVPGVPGIGPKIAAALIDEFGNLDNLLDNLDDVKQNARRGKLQANVDQARLSRVLVELDRHVPLSAMKTSDGQPLLGTKRPQPVDGLPPPNATDASDMPVDSFEMMGDLRMQPLNPDRILAFYDQMGFKDLQRRFKNQINPPNKAKRRRPSWPPRREKAEVPKPEDYADVPF